MRTDLKPKQLPSGKWRIQIQILGRRHSVTADTRQECINKAVLLQAEYESGANDNKKYILENITLREIVNEYIGKRDKVLSPSTLNGYDSIVNTRFQNYMDLPAAAVNWQRMINEECDLVSAVTVGKAWSLVKSALVEYGIYPVKVSLPQKIEKEQAFIEPEDFQRFIKSIEGDRNEIGILLALHGLRRSEIYAVRKEDVSDGVIRVRGATVRGRDGKWVNKDTNKNQTSRRDVPILIPRLEKLVKKAPSGLLCPPNHSSVYRAVKKHCKEIGIDEVTLHGLRHSFASLCYHLDLSELETMRLGGWKDYGVMRKKYTHLAQKDECAAVSKLKGFFAD